MSELTKFDIKQELCKYSFSEEEKKEFSVNMANKISEFHEVTDQKKAVMSDFKSKLDALSAEINTMARKVKDGYEMRYMDCEIRKDYDKKIVSYVRVDNDEVVRTRIMTEEDMQLKLNDDKNSKEEETEEQK